MYSVCLYSGWMYSILLNGGDNGGGNGSGVGSNYRSRNANLNTNDSQSGEQGGGGPKGRVGLRAWEP